MLKVRAMRRLALGLVTVALVAVAVLLPHGHTAALEPGDPPDTYMDPIPDYVNASFVDNLLWITGTSIAAPYRVVDNVEVQIMRDFDGFRWDDVGGMWINDIDLWNDATVGVVTWGNNQWDWEYTGGTLPTSADFQSGLSYTVKARAIDDDGYKDLSPPSDTFICDDADPEVSFTTVFPSTIYDELDVIEGTASDDDGEVDNVRLRIRNLDEDKYWSGHFWHNESVWVTAEGTTTWHLDFNTSPPMPSWMNNACYQVAVDVIDKAGNKDTAPPAPKEFTYRRDMASAGAYLDPLPEYSNGMDEFSGTSMAEAPGRIVDVRVKIRDLTEAPDWYWNATAGDWTASVYWSDCVNASVMWMPAYGQTDWVATVPGGLSWLNGHTYCVQARATDNSTPVPNTYDSGTSCFDYDDADPGSTIDAFDVVVYNTLDSLTGGAYDGGLGSGEIGALVMLINRSMDGLYWSGSGWGNDEWGNPGGEWWDWVFAPAQDGAYNSDNEDWEITRTTEQPLPAWKNGEQYTITTRAVDKAGNVESTAIKSFEFRIDLTSYTPPTPTPTPTATSTAVVWIDFPDAPGVNVTLETYAGAEFVVRTNISDVYRLYTANYDITYNAAVVEVVRVVFWQPDVRKGKIGGENFPVNSCIFQPQKTQGRLRVIQYLDAYDWRTGSGYMSRIYFRVVGSPGQASPVRIEEVRLGDWATDPIPHSTTNSSVLIIAAPPSPTPTATPSTTPTPPPGDANGNGAIDAGDITALERIILEGPPFPPGADANGDGDVNAADIGVVEYMILEIWPWDHVHIEAPDSLAHCNSFTATVFITYVEGFGSAGFEVSYDPDVLDLLGVSGGRMLEIDPGVSAEMHTVAIDDWGLHGGPGAVRINASIAGNPGPDGAGYLAQLQFHVNGSAGQGSAIAFNETQSWLRDSLGDAIDATWAGDWFTVAP